MVCSQFQGLPGTCRREHGVPQTLKHDGGHDQDGRFILDEQNGLLAAECDSPGFLRYESGISKVARQINRKSRSLPRFAKPMPVDPSHFKNPRRDQAYVVLAGLLANIALAIAGALVVGGWFALRKDPQAVFLLKRLAELSVGFPVDTEEPFARVKGKLGWPVDGRLVGDYGQPRGAGPVKWTGVMVEATAGTPVRAVYHGRVAFADWLQGLGLLLIVDHGGGYMSLYGHNEALLKESGDWVQPGETIAQVGDSGGQARPGVYFEIRYNGEPVNPHPWIARAR